MLIALAAAGQANADAASIDEATAFNQLTANSTQTARTSSVTTLRISAIVQWAVLGAVNGVERRFTSHLVIPEGTRGTVAHTASQVVYATFFTPFPSQKSILDLRREVAVTALADANTRPIGRGVRWEIGPQTRYSPCVAATAP